MEENTDRPAHRLLSPVLALTGTVMALQQTLVIPLLPVFPGLLDVSPVDASWLVTSTLLAGGVSMPLLSRMADMYGKRRMMLVAIGFLTAGSLTALVWNTFIGIVIARTLQGFSMAIIPIGMSVLKDHLTAVRLSRSIALMSATMGIGGALGMPLSGLIYELAGWRAIFGVTLVAGVVLAAAILVVVPGSAPSRRTRFDTAGGILLGITVTSGLLVISKATEWGWTAPATLAAVVAGTAAAALLVPLELRLPAPMLDLRLAATGKVMVANLFAVCSGFTMFASMLLVIQQLQLPADTGFSHGLAPLAAGLCMVPGGLAMTVLSPVTGSLISRFGPERVMAGAGILMATGYSSLLMFNSTVLLIILGSTIVSTATALSFAAQPTLMMALVPPGQTAAANGVNALMRSVGTSIASAVAGSTLAAFLVQQGELSFPSWTGFQVVYVAGICVGLAAAALAALIVPWPPRRTVRLQEG